MNVYVNSITGVDDAIVSMFMSKRTWTRELERKIRATCAQVLERDGKLITHSRRNADDLAEFSNWLGKLLQWGQKHITMLRFIDISVTVEGLHRGGQDDWDSHAYRFNNRIIRTSTRLSEFSQNEISGWYEDKIIPTDVALAYTGISTPEEICIGGDFYIRTVNGYIKKEFKDNKDVKRGLYMMSIPSNFIFKINLTEWAHVYKERNASSSANPEVKECCEAIANQLEFFNPEFNRELFMKIQN